MGYDLYFINETKRQIAHSKVLPGGFEYGAALLAYLSRCQGDTIRIVGEDDALVEAEQFSEAPAYEQIDLST